MARRGLEGVPIRHHNDFCQAILHPKNKIKYTTTLTSILLLNNLICGNQRSQGLTRKKGKNLVLQLSIFMSLLLVSNDNI